jgi:hypothetical protein
MRDKPLRLYRGMTRRHDPSRAPRQVGGGTDFTDCPVTALDYARGRNGCLLVLEVPPESRHRVTEEDWLVGDAKRLMMWGAFELDIVAEIPAKELRRELRFPGASRYEKCDKRRLLERSIEQRLQSSRPRTGSD